MAKNPRIHEVAKAIGSSSKVLMGELAGEGYEFKTHMAVLEGDALAYVKKKHSDLDAKLAELAAAAKAAPKKPTARKKKKKVGGRVVTTRTREAKKAASDEAASPAKAKTTVVERDQGLVGTVTLEQKVIKGGIIRRRRVEETPEPPAAEAPKAPEVTKPAAPEAPAEAPTVEEKKPVVRRAEKEEAAPEVKAEAQPKPEKKPAAPSAAEKKKTEEVVIEKPAPRERSGRPPRGGGAREPRRGIPGRNLSAAPRLKVVGEGKTPQQIAEEQEARRIAVEKAKAASAAEAQKRQEEKAKAAAEKEKERESKKKARTGATGAGRHYSKRDLMNMTEEVEITKTYGRRPKKPQRGGRTQSHEKKQTQQTVPSAQKRKIRIQDEILVSDLADRMSVKAADVVRKLLAMGQMVTVHQPLDFETASIIAAEYEYEVENVAETVEDILDSKEETEKDAELTERPAVVTVMGHVDHGKTSLLDYIRESRVAAGESGGITQHIGAYQVEKNGKKITFIDTPGHAAFTKMRARGAGVTDIVILVVAADEGVKPQTLEAIAHAKDAKVPIIVAINKMDKPEANPDRVIQELSSHELVPEDWGGDTMFAKVSAQTGDGVDGLLEMILLQAEVLELKANAKRKARGVIIESRLDKGRGPVATALIQKGTLSKGDSLVSGLAAGRVRAMLNEQGQPIETAGPSAPVEILGFDLVPEVGDEVVAVEEGAVAKKATNLALENKRRAEAMKSSKLTLEDMMAQIQAGEMTELRVVLKGDAHGSVEAIADSLEKIEHDKVRVKVVFKAVGGISETDVSLASASGALVLGFHVRPTGQAREFAQDEGVTIKTFDVIYELIDEVKKAMSGLLQPIFSESVLGQAEVRETYSISRMGTVAGCLVKEGKMVRNAKCRLIRDGVVIYTTKIDSLKRFKDDAKEVKEGIECGMMLENFNDIKVGDIIEAFEEVAESQMVG